MTKDQIVTAINHVKDDSGLELYFVLDDGSIKFARIKDDAINELKEQFINELIQLFVEDDGYSLLNIQEADDGRGDVFYYFDHTNIYDNLKFIVDFSESGSNDTFSFDNDELGNIRAFIIKISNENKSIFLYKKHYPINLLKQSSVLRLIKSDDKFDKLTQDVINIDKSFDFLFLDSHIIITKMKTLERFFGYEDYIKKTALKNLALIEALDFIDDIQHIQQSLGKKRYAKKLNKALQTSPVPKMIEDEKEKVLEFIKKHPLLENRIKVLEDDKKIELKSIKSVEAFLKLLDDDYLKSDLTKMLYESSGKNKLPTAQP
ncbi:anti-phage protein KwaB [Hydrogenimonas sp.]